MTTTLRVITASGIVLTRSARGITPLWEMYAKNADALCGASVEDKVIGLGAAVIMVASGIHDFKTPLISRHALVYLSEHGIHGTADAVVDNIINRAGTGICPLESKLLNTAPTEYLQAVKEFAESLPRRAQKVKSVLFDLDGVLVDTESVYTEFWEEIDRIYPTNVPNFAYVIKGNTLTRILSTYFPEAERRVAIEERLLAHEANMQYRLFAGVDTMLQQLKSAGITIAIVTSSNTKKMDHLFEQIPLLRQVTDALVTDEDVHNSKPDPEGYLLAAQRLNTPIENCVIVEDSLAGLRAGRNAGAFVVGIATTNPKDLIAPLSDIVLPSASMLYEVLSPER